ncbi:MAG: 30S ribosomal protein S20 [Holosporales bacterium]|jgi:small subunit ribosomal protein S20|nr:30S ribosomal protein S20 [Holosporales bacterium]
MASHASAKKSVRKAAKQRVVNRNRISRIRTCIRKLSDDVAQKAAGETMLKSLRTVQSEIMRGVSKHVVHRNTAARVISKWTHRVKCILEMTVEK